MRQYTSQSTIRPREWDSTSSPDVVYHNYDIVEVTATEDMPTMFNYTVDEYTTLEYLKLQDAKIAVLEEQNALLTGCVLEMSAAVYS